MTARLVRHSSALFLVENNVRRRIVRPQDIPHVLESYPELRIEDVDEANIRSIDIGPRVPRSLAPEWWVSPPDNKQIMREIIASRLTGQGIEFGAGSRPMPVPISVAVDYVEPFQSEEQYRRMHYADVVRPKYSCPIENQRDIADATQDFVVAAHVIEHTPNPIGAIAESYRVLKPGGQMVLVVPDKRRTFDRPRVMTEMSHLLEDYETPDRERDLENYLDFFSLVKRTSNPEGDAREAWSKGMDIHYHVWTPGSFMEMMGIIVQRYAPFRAVEVKEGVTDPQCLEFYVWAKK